MLTSILQVNFNARIPRDRAAGVLMHGNFFWYDLMTTDVEAASKFYADVVGWGLQDTAPDMNYTLFTVKDQGVAGLMPIPEEAAKMGGRPCWTGYIAVDDVDKAAAQLKEAGGMIHKPPTDIPGIIRFAVVADPQGAVFIIAKGLRDAPMPAFDPATPGLAGWRELYAADGTAAFAFYEKMFGWTKAEAMDMGPMGVYQLFKTGGADAVGGMMTKPEAIPLPCWGYYFNIPATDAAAARVTKGGGKIVNGPMEVPGGQWIVQCVDPQGAYFSLVGPTR
jgi:predicted enzyme related to lactoylglutathione lyase